MGLAGPVAGSPHPVLARRNTLDVDRRAAGRGGDAPPGATRSASNTLSNFIRTARSGPTVRPKPLGEAGRPHAVRSTAPHGPKGPAPPAEGRRRPALHARERAPYRCEAPARVSLSPRMERVPEPELMDDEAQSIAYAKADFSASNQMFVDGFIGECSAHLGAVVDLGCGPGDIDIRLARASRSIAITAVDGSPPMLAIAERAVRSAGLESRIRLLHGVLPGLPLEAHRFDAVVSKDLLHHLPDPRALWSEVARLGRPGGTVYVMDLVRPQNRESAQRIVDAVAPHEDPILREDFLNSLCAAFTVDEVAQQLRDVRLDLQVARVSDRHMLITGSLK